MKPIKIPINKLVETWGSPFDRNIWGTRKRVTKRTIARCLREKIFEQTPFKEGIRESTYNHSARIAFLIENRSEFPIELDVGCLYFFPDWPITDGNHRFIAAFYQGDEFIETYFNGDIKRGEEIFGVKCN